MAIIIDLIHETLPKEISVQIISAYTGWTQIILSKKRKPYFKYGCTPIQEKSSVFIIVCVKMKKKNHINLGWHEVTEF